MKGGRAAVFTPLGVERRADAVTKRLVDGINAGLLQADEQLPSESALAEAFGVASVTVREALTTLRAEGLLVTRRGRNGGSFVAPRSAGADHEALLGRLGEVSPSGLRDLADHYVAISGTCALLAADRAHPDETDLIEECVRLMERAGDAAARRRAAARFQVELAAAAQSPRLTRAVLSMQADVGALLLFTNSTDDAREGTITRHRDLLAAVRAADGQRARGHAATLVYTALARASALQLTLLAPEDAPAPDPQGAP